MSQKSMLAIPAAPTILLIDELREHFELREIANLSGVPLKIVRNLHYNGPMFVGPEHAAMIADFEKQSRAGRVDPVLEFVESVRGRVFIELCRAGRAVLEQCRNGHIRTTTNSVVGRNGKLRCRDCERAATARKRERVAAWKIAQAAA